VKGRKKNKLFFEGRHRTVYVCIFCMIYVPMWFILFQTEPLPRFKLMDRRFS